MRESRTSGFVRGRIAICVPTAIYLTVIATYGVKAALVYYLLNAPEYYLHYTSPLYISANRTAPTNKQLVRICLASKIKVCDCVCHGDLMVPIDMNDCLGI